MNLLPQRMQVLLLAARDCVYAAQVNGDCELVVSGFTLSIAMQIRCPQHCVLGRLHSGHHLVMDLRIGKATTARPADWQGHLCKWLGTRTASLGHLATTCVLRLMLLFVCRHLLGRLVTICNVLRTDGLNKHKRGLEQIWLHIIGRIYDHACMCA